MSTSDFLNNFTSSSLAKCPTLKGKDNFTEWEEVMKSNLRTSGCWPIVSGEAQAPSIPNPFYTSYNKPSGVNTLRLAEAEYSRCDNAGNFIHSDDICKDRVQEIKGQVNDYETYIRLKEKAKNLIMDSMTKDLWHQRINKDDPKALWQELRDDYHMAGVPELTKELTKFSDMTRTTHSNPQTLLNALKTQHSKIVTLKATMFDSDYLSWRYIHEMNKFKPLFDIPLAKYDALNEYPPPDEIKRAIEAHLLHHPDIPKKPTVEKPSQPTTASANTNVAQTPSNKKRKRGEKKDSDKNDRKSSSSEKPSCPHCEKQHFGDCWVKYPDKMPQAVRDSIAKRQKGDAPKSQ
jgi:hypothetical protein